MSLFVDRDGSHNILSLIVAQRQVILTRVNPAVVLSAIAKPLIVDDLWRTLAELNGRMNNPDESALEQ